MATSPHELAAHTLRVKTPALAWDATSALYRLRPELEWRYGEAGRRRCAKDITHHLRFLAAATDLADPKIFTDYAAWAYGVMVTHNVAAEDALASFRCLLEAAPAAVVADAAPFVREAITRAVGAIESAAGMPRPVPRPRPRHATPVSPSTAGSAPSRS